MTEKLGRSPFKSLAQATTFHLALFFPLPQAALGLVREKAGDVNCLFFVSRQFSFVPYLWFHTSGMLCPAHSAAHMHSMQSLTTSSMHRPALPCTPSGTYLNIEWCLSPVVRPRKRVGCFWCSTLYHSNTNKALSCLSTPHSSPTHLGLCYS